jgi:plasmid rolling circle replication initiator protein Rep
MSPSDNQKKPLTSHSLAAEGKEGFQTTQLGARLERYGKARENALQFRDFLLGQQEHKLADALGDCGNYATFRDYFTVGQIRLAEFCTCKKHLICPLCAIRRGAKALRIYLARVEHLLNADRRLKAFLVTLTVKNGDDLDERFRHLAGNLRAYHKRRKGRGQKGEILKAKSAVWSYEFTNKGKGWHPHVHAVWLSHEVPDVELLAQEWHQLTGDSFIVDVTPMDMTDPVSAFCEVFKYALKFSDLADPQRLHAYKTLKGKRLQDSFGELRGLDVEPSESDDLLEDLPYIERLFYFHRGVGYVGVTPTGEVFQAA